MFWTLLRARSQPYCQEQALVLAPVQVPYGVPPVCGQVSTCLRICPGLAVLRYSCALGCVATAPEEFDAQVSSELRHGLAVVARPPLTPTTPNAWSVGSVVPHWG